MINDIGEEKRLALLPKAIVIQGNLTRSYSRRLVLHSDYFATMKPDIRHPQEGQIVQSELNLRDFLP